MLRRRNDVPSAIVSSGELEDLGAEDLKGIVGPVRAWAVLRPSYVESRFDAFHASGLTELVGREEELDCTRAAHSLALLLLPTTY
jgi:hypothetical protein